MNEWRIHSFAVSIFLIVPRPISEFKCSARLVCRELSRIVCPCPRARYLLSSPDSHIIMATPSLSKSIWLASVDIIPSLDLPNWGRPWTKNGGLWHDTYSGVKSTHSSSNHLHDIQVRIFLGDAILE